MIKATTHKGVSLPRSRHFEYRHVRPFGRERRTRTTVVLGCGTRSEVLHIEHVARRRSLSIKTGYQILTRVVMQESARVHTGTKIPMVTR
jgi:hypothetical protein